MRWSGVMRGGGLDGAPVVSSGVAALSRTHDRAGGRDGTVLGRRVQSREDLDGLDVGGSHLLQDLEVIDREVVEDHAYLIVLVDARPPAPLDPGGLAVDLTQLHVRNRQPERVPRGLGTGLGDCFGRDDAAGARRVPLRGPGPWPGAYEGAPQEHRAARDKMRRAQHAAPPDCSVLHPWVNRRWHPA